MLHRTPNIMAVEQHFRNTAGDDSQALIWDLSSMSQSMDQGLGAAASCAPLQLLMLANVPRHRLLSVPVRILFVVVHAAASG